MPSTICQPNKAKPAQPDQAHADQQKLAPKPSLAQPSPCQHNQAQPSTVKHGVQTPSIPPQLNTSRRRLRPRTSHDFGLRSPESLEKVTLPTAHSPSPAHSASPAQANPSQATQHSHHVPPGTAQSMAAQAAMPKTVEQAVGPFKPSALKRIAPQIAPQGL